MFKRLERESKELESKRRKGLESFELPKPRGSQRE